MSKSIGVFEFCRNISDPVYGLTNMGDKIVASVNGSVIEGEVRLISERGVRLSGYEQGFVKWINVIALHKGNTLVWERGKDNGIKRIKVSVSEVE